MGYDFTSEASRENIHCNSWIWGSVLQELNRKKIGQYERAMIGWFHKTEMLYKAGRSDDQGMVMIKKHLHSFGQIILASLC